MDSQLHALLMTFDSPSEWECPTDFDWQQSLAGVRRFQEDAFEKCGVNFELDDQIQDASFFADLWENPFGETSCGVRFSNFGGFALISLGGIRHYQSEGFPTCLIQLLESMNYTVVRPEDVYQASYDGRLSVPPGDNWLTGSFTWFTRFFDYQ